MSSLLKYPSCWVQANFQLTQQQLNAADCLVISIQYGMTSETRPVQQFDARSDRQILTPSHSECLYCLETMILTYNSRATWILLFEHRFALASLHLIFLILRSYSIFFGCFKKHSSQDTENCSYVIITASLKQNASID